MRHNTYKYQRFRSSSSFHRTPYFPSQSPFRSFPLNSANSLALRITPTLFHTSPQVPYLGPAHSSTTASPPDTHHHGRHSLPPISHPGSNRSRPRLGETHPWVRGAITARDTFGPFRCEQGSSTVRSVAHARVAVKPRHHSCFEAVQPSQKANQAPVPWTSGPFLGASPEYGDRKLWRWEHPRPEQILRRIGLH